jgi:hypothetical protein
MGLTWIIIYPTWMTRIQLLKTKLQLIHLHMQYYLVTNGVCHGSCDTTNSIEIIINCNL